MAIHYNNSDHLIKHGCEDHNLIYVNVMTVIGCQCTYNIVILIKFVNLYAVFFFHEKYNSSSSKNYIIIMDKHN